MNQGRLLCGKYGSLWRWEYSHYYMRGVKKVKGVYTTAMEYARKHKGGLALIEHARIQPWETWQRTKLVYLF